MNDNLKIGAYDTLKHILRVRDLMNVLVKELLERGELHDLSKLESPEIEAFTEKGPQLKHLEFNSEEYNKCKRDIDEAIQHHYAHNRHHPEHFKNGIADMNLVDLLEMFVDWKASSERQHNGNLRKSIEINGARFNFPPLLVKIFENTMEVIE